MYSFSGTETYREVVQRLKSEFAFVVLDIFLKILVLQIHLKTIKIYEKQMRLLTRKKVLQIFGTDDVLRF